MYCVIPAQAGIQSVPTVMDLGVTAREPNLLLESKGGHAVDRSNAQRGNDQALGNKGILHATVATTGTFVRNERHREPINTWRGDK